jgi:hypothetical protein
MTELLAASQGHISVELVTLLVSTIKQATTNQYKVRTVNSNLVWPPFEVINILQQFIQAEF